MRRRALPVALGIGGLVLVLGSALPTLGEDSFARTSYGSASPGAAVLVTLTGGAIFAAATLLAIDPRWTWVALATFLLGMTWIGDPLAGWSGPPDVVQAIGMLFVPLLAPAALLVVASLTPRGAARNASVALVGLGFLAGGALALVRDPFLDRYCWRDCLASSIAPFGDVEHLRTLTAVTLWLGATSGLAIFVLVRSGLRRVGASRLAAAPALVTGLIVGVVLAAHNLTLVLDPAEDPDRAAFATLFALRGLALLGFAVGLGAVALRPRYVRAAMARLASDPARANLATSLADALGDPALHIGYPLSDGRLVDANGRLVALGTTATRIVRGGELVALVDSPGGQFSPAALNSELGPAGRLALANERLRAEQLARLRELTGLRRRIVAAGDAERQRLERDLHDGAQQRLLALTFDLRVALTRAEPGGRPELVTALESAVEHVTQATEELREVAHGLVPAVLSTSGLAAALETMAETRPFLLSVRIDRERRYPAAVEAAAYAVVAECTDSAERPARVNLHEQDESLVVTIDDAPANGSVVSIEDRVGAVGGVVERSERQLRAVLPLRPPD